MNFLRLENNYSWLITKEDKVKNLLWKGLRFKSRGCFFSPAYKNKTWDGYVDFFKKESGRFLTGLLPEVLFALERLKIDYKIEDKRGEFSFLADSVDENLFNCSSYQTPIVLRDYQVDYINQVIKNKRGIIPSPTGSGKSRIMSGILKIIPPGTPTLVLANKKQLVEQNYDEIIKWDIKNVGRLHGTVKKPDIITCATVQSAHHLGEELSNVKVLIVDEIHEMMSKEPREIYAKLKNACVRVAMSATAFKFGGTDKCQKYEVKGWIGPMFTTSTTEEGKLTTKELQDRKILAASDCSFFMVEEPSLPYEVYLDAVTKGIAENNYFHKMVSKLVSCLDGRILIIVERIEHGDRLQEMIPNCLWVRGQDTVDTRRQIIEQLRMSQGKVVSIATSGIFDAGIDVFVHNLVNAAGGQAEHKIIQRFGRGLRRASDKDSMKYYDFYFTINEYLEKHSKKRISILKKEGHNVNVYNANEIDKLFVF